MKRPRWIALTVVATVLIGLVFLGLRWAGAGALDWAVDSRSHHLLRLFLAIGIPPDRCSETRGSPAGAAVFEDDVEALDIFLEAGLGVDWTRNHCQDMTLLTQAADLGHVRSVRYLIDAGANLNAIYYGGDFKTPYMYALENGHVEVAELLRSKGAFTGEEGFGLEVPVLRAPATRDRR